MHRGQNRKPRGDAPNRQELPLATTKRATHDREQAIEEILSGITEKLNGKEASDIEKDISFKAVYDATREAPNGKAPGPGGIPNEFWKEEMKWRREAKEKGKFQPRNTGEGGKRIRPCIAALMAKVFRDIESFGPRDNRFSECWVSGIFCKTLSVCH